MSRPDHKPVGSTRENGESIFEMTQRTLCDAENVRDLLRSCLMQREAMDLDEITDRLDLDYPLVISALQRLVDDGEVEVLHPVCVSEGVCDGNLRLNAGRTLEHYRLVRETDDAYLWEQEVVVRLPACRMFNVRQIEERREQKSIRPQNITVNANLSSRSAGLAPAFT